jgi:hypothetical protein
MNETSSTAEAEKRYYTAIRHKLEDLLRARVDSLYLETTADKNLGPRLQAHIQPGRDIVFAYLKKVRPDMTGVVTQGGLTHFIVVEVKTGEIELDHIYQLKKYTDLLNAKFAFLVSLASIPVEMKHLARTTHALLHGPSSYETYCLAHFDVHSGDFVEWYPKNPFEQDYLWR